MTTGWLTGGSPTIALMLTQLHPRMPRVSTARRCATRRCARVSLSASGYCGLLHGAALLTGVVASVVVRRLDERASDSDKRFERFARAFRANLLIAQ